LEATIDRGLTALSPAERAARLRELRPFVAQAQQMQGWTFAYAPLPLGSPPPWDYAARAAQLLRQARRVLDLGTGGGEVFSRILAGFSGLAVATEAWAPNVPVAARRLASAGARLVHASSLDLPLAASSFDLVLDRHEELAPAEVARVLAPGGALLTQQIHPDWHAELRTAFPRMTRFEPHHQTYPQGLEAAGLELVDFRGHQQPMAYQQLGHLVYVLVAAPWTVPDFDLDADLDALLALEQTLRRPEGLVLTDRRYLVEARKPA
jgi:SAM-dependent methyltransferase